MNRITFVLRKQKTIDLTRVRIVETRVKKVIYFKPVKPVIVKSDEDDPYKGELPYGCA